MSCLSSVRHTAFAKAALLLAALVIAFAGAFFATADDAHADSAWISSDAYNSDPLYYGGAGYYTTLFYYGNNLGYCSYPAASTPWSGSYTKYGVNRLTAAVLYYGYGGPGFDYAVSQGWWPSRNYEGDAMSWVDYYTSTHVLAAYAENNMATALYSTSWGYQDWALNTLFNYTISNMASHYVPDDFAASCFAVYPGNNTPSGGAGQSMVFSTYQSYGGLSITKREQYTNRPMSGVRFNIYYTDANNSYQGSFVTSITTDANGYAQTEINRLKVGHYRIVEANAPANFTRITNKHVVVQNNFSRNHYNLYDTEEMKVTFYKQWNGAVPLQAKFNIYRNGQFYKQETVAMGNGTLPSGYAGMLWTMNFSYPRHDESHVTTDNVYTIKEVGESGGYITIGNNTYQVKYSGNTITNTKVKSFTVSKTWDDQNNKYGTRPSSVDVTLYRASSTLGRSVVGTVTLNDANNWTYTWTNLPTVADDSSMLYYSATEDTSNPAFTGYYQTQAGDGEAQSRMDFTNSLETTSVSVSKQWIGSNAKPSTITLYLKNGSTTVDTATINNASTNWTYTFNNVPIYDASGNPMEYTVEEAAVSGYTSKVVQTGDNQFTIKNISTEKKNIPVTKTWNHTNNTGTLPSSATVALYANDIPTGQTLTFGSSGGTQSFANMAKYDSEGNEIDYSLKETTVSGYASIINENADGSFAVENRYGVVSIPVTKTWNDNGAGTGYRPSSITVYLYADGAKVDTMTITTPSSSTTASGTFSNKPKYNAEGKEIVYTIGEADVPLYSATISGYNITNKYTANERAIKFTKTWNDDNNSAGKRPSSVSVNLLQQTYSNAQKLTAANVTATNHTNYTIPSKRFLAGAITGSSNASNAVFYIFNSYDASNTGSPTIVRTNSNGVYDITLSGSQVALAGSFSDLIYQYVTTSNGTPYFVEWSYNWSSRVNQKTNRYWHPVGYYLTGSTAIPLFLVKRNSTTDAYAIQNINTSTTPPTSMKLATAANATTIYNSSATTVSYASGSKLVVPNNVTQSAFSPTMTANTAYNMGFYYTNSTSSNQTITIKIYTTANYETSRNSGTASFTATPGTHYYTISNVKSSVANPKISLFNGSTNVTASAMLGTLYNGSLGTASTARTITISSSGGWTTTATGLPKFNTSTNAPIVYSASELSVPYYSTSRTGDADGGYTFKNSMGVVDVPVKKIWNDNNDEKHLRPSSVTVSLLANGTATGKTLTLNEANGWQGVFENLEEVDSSRNHITYTVTETRSNHYSSPVIAADAASGGFTVTNSIALTRVPVSKVWSDNNNAGGKRPASVTVRLWANGTDTGKTLTLSEGNNWESAFEDLDVYNASGNTIAYTITEDSVTGYSPTITGNASMGFTVTNAATLRDISVEKIWNDNNNAAGDRPASVTAVLKADGSQVQTAVLSEDNNWKATFEDLPIKNGNTDIVYTIDEQSFTGDSNYTKILGGDAENGFTITNAKNISFSVDKNWDDANDADQYRPSSVTIRLMANGSPEGSTLTLDDSNGWHDSFTNLPSVDNSGTPINYTITEDAVAHYTTTITGNTSMGFLVTNSHTKELTRVVVSKQWVDDDDQDRIRPSSITVRLLQDGVPMSGKVATVTAADDWQAEFSGLPISDGAGHDYEYSVSEDAVSGYTTELYGSQGRGFTLINTHHPEYIDIPVEKTWPFANNDERVPSSITVRLFQNETEYASATISPDAQTGLWEYTFTHCPLYDPLTGDEYEYTLQEDPVADYYPQIGGSAEDGFLIQNRYMLSETPITGIKIWKDEGPSTRPASVTVHLFQNGVEVAQRTVTPNADGEWYYEFGNWPVIAQDGSYYIYQVREDVPANYEAKYTQFLDGTFCVENQLLKEVDAEKVWVDNDNANGNRPSAVKLTIETGYRTHSTWMQYQETQGSFRLREQAEATGTMEIMWDGSSAGTITASVYDASDALVTSTTFTASRNHSYLRAPITNLPTTGDLTVRFTLGGNNVSEHVVDAKVYGDDISRYDYKSMNVNQACNWSLAYGSLPAYDDYGAPITYYVHEEPVPGYIGQVTGDETTGFTITNTEDSRIHVEKIWEGDDPANRPASIAVDLIRNGVVVDTQTITPSGSVWEGEFTNVSFRDASGNAYNYTVSEHAIPGYVEEVSGNAQDGFTIANRPTTSVSVSKVWEGDAQRLEMRPTSVDVSLKRHTTEPIDLVNGQSRSTWNSYITNEIADSLAHYGTLSKVSYSLRNDNAEPVVVKLELGPATAPYASTMFEIEGQSTATGELNLSGVPASMASTSFRILPLTDNDPLLDALISQNLFGGTITFEYDDTPQSTTITNTSWTGSFNGLITTDGKRQMTYSVEENPVPAGYVSTVSGTQESGYTITNSYGCIDVPVNKVWNDMDDFDGIRPASVTVKLLADGVDTGKTLVLNEENHWSGVFAAVDEKNGDNYIDYSVEEVSVPSGYEAKVTGDQFNGFTVENNHDVKISITGSKVWDDQDDLKGIRPTQITVKLLADGTEVSSALVEDDGNGEWKFSFENLDYLDDNGNVIVYTVTEEEVVGYVDSYGGDAANGFTITNWTAAPVNMPQVGREGLVATVVLGSSIVGGLLIAGAAYLVLRSRRVKSKSTGDTNK